MARGSSARQLCRPNKAPSSTCRTFAASTGGAMDAGASGNDTQAWASKGSTNHRQTRNNCAIFCFPVISVLYPCAIAKSPAPAAADTELKGESKKMRSLSAAEIEKAASKIDPAYRNSPLVFDTGLDELLGVELSLKVECLNPIRSFKGRGADLFVSGLDTPTSLVCASAGNFGQGIARAGRRSGCDVTVFAAENANPFKIDAMRRFGADVRLEGSDFDVAKSAAQKYARIDGGIFVEDGAHPSIAEGAGTMALEMTRDGAKPDVMLVPLGNGSLATGIGAWFKYANPATKIICVVAEGAPSMKLSFERGEVITTPSANTIADGIAVRQPVPYALECMQAAVDAVVAVNDETILEAMRLIHIHLGLAVEPAGAAGVAALLADKDCWRGKRVASVLCGSNMTPEQLKKWFC